MGLGLMSRKEKAACFLRVLRYTFSLANASTILLSYGHFIYDQVLGMAHVHTKEDPWIHPTASLRSPHNVYLGNNSHISCNCCIGRPELPESYSVTTCCWVRGR
jgi:hypothetical protein